MYHTFFFQLLFLSLLLTYYLSFSVSREAFLVTLGFKKADHSGAFSYILASHAALTLTI